MKGLIGKVILLLSVHISQLVLCILPDDSVEDSFMICACEIIFNYISDDRLRPTAI